MKKVSIDAECSVKIRGYNMLRKITMFIGVISLIVCSMPVIAFAQKVGVFFDSSVAQIQFAAGDVKTALESKNFSVELLPLSSLNSTYANRKVVIAVAGDSAVTKVMADQGGTIPGGLGEQAYGLQTTQKGETSYWVVGGDINGAMYGGLQIAENIKFDGFSGNYNNQESPDILQRGAKLNLPLDKRLPTYSGNFGGTSAMNAIPSVWDMTFWTAWLDEMARNRYNVLSVWVHNPFPALVKVAGYEKACLPDIQGFDGYQNNLNLEQRIKFWRHVMTYAHQRGFTFYFFCWNVNPDFAKDQYSSITNSESNTTTLEYLNKSMTSLLVTYPELDGFGISAGDGMKGTPEERISWTWKAYGKAVYDYALVNPARNFTLIHRGLSASLTTIYKYYDPLKTLSNVKFDFSIKYCMAHMYSTLTPKWYASQMDEAVEANQKTWLTLRNDDFFYADWGDPKFVRDFIDNIPNKQIIRGFYIGADVYNPTRTYWCKDSAMNGQLEIKRNWYIHMLWGRIAYDRQISDDVFKKHMALRFPQVSSEDLFTAWAKASRPLPKITELTQAQWRLDVHWYPEACVGRNDGKTTFKTIAEMMDVDIAKGSKICSIAKSASDSCGNAKSSYELADEMEADAMSALALIKPMTGGGNSGLNGAINNVKQLAYLSNYYAYKIRGATFKKAGQTANARDAMGKAYCWWMSYANLMDARYMTDKFRTYDISPNWHFADEANLKEYTDLGGIGIPDYK